MTKNKSTAITELPDKEEREQMSSQKRQAQKIKNLLRKWLSPYSE